MVRWYRRRGERGHPRPSMLASERLHKLSGSSAASRRPPHPVYPVKISVDLVGREGVREEDCGGGTSGARFDLAARMMFRQLQRPEQFWWLQLSERHAMRQR